MHGLSPRELELLRDLPADAAEWQEILTVSVHDENALDPIPMLGTVRLEETLLVFEPRFPWKPGLRYEAVFRLAEGEPRSHRFSIPKPMGTSSTELVAVYPSADELPSNLLKFYLQFSAPMARGEAYERIRLVDSERGEVELAFLELGEELWDTTGTRFTLLFDPGRIKRGVKPLEEVGPSLEPERSYTLVVESAWRDAEGLPLKAGFEKPFRTSAPDRVQPDPTSWRLEPPTAGSQDALRVSLDEPLDRAELERMLRVRGSSGDLVAGAVTIEEDERRWSFRPDADWLAGSYALVVDTTLEDRAGNSIGRAFETKLDAAEPVEAAAAVRAPESIELAFRVLEVGG